MSEWDDWDNGVYSNEITARRGERRGLIGILTDPNRLLQPDDETFDDRIKVLEKRIYELLPFTVTILRSIVDLINTSQCHSAWLDPHPLESGWLAPGSSIAEDRGRLHVRGPKIGNWDPENDQIALEGATLKIGTHRFDLNDPKSLDQIEELFGCDTERKPEFNPMEVISELMDD